MSGRFNPLLSCLSLDENWNWCLIISIRDKALGISISKSLGFQYYSREANLVHTKRLEAAILNFMSSTCIVSTWFKRKGLSVIWHTNHYLVYHVMVESALWKTSMYTVLFISRTYSEQLGRKLLYVSLGVYQKKVEYFFCFVTGCHLSQRCVCMKQLLHLHVLSKGCNWDHPKK